tara:strand:- start:1137 stop:1325 length:189 start_codon:yes stop_codon:yes gene_type:complete
VYKKNLVYIFPSRYIIKKQKNRILKKSIIFTSLINSEIKLEMIIEIDIDIAINKSLLLILGI